MNEKLAGNSTADQVNNFVELGLLQSYPAEQYVLTSLWDCMGHVLRLNHANDES